MDKHSQIKKVLESFGLKQNLPITAKVIAVDNDTCTIKLDSSLVLTDVRLNATITNDTDTFLITPKIGSEVIVLSQTGELSGLIVIKINSVEKIEYKKDDFEFEVDGINGKVSLKKQGANFGLLITNLIDAIAGIQTINSDATTGALNPAVITQFQQLKTNFNLVLNSD